MFAKFFASRLLHTSCIRMESATKSLLAKLRKKTGYTFANCKKALEISENDLIKAEKWLAEQAQAMGWDKATKLAGRKTTQGLIAAVSEGDSAAMIEVNCETDFVARNAYFQDFAAAAAKACFYIAKEQRDFENIRKLFLNGEDLKSLVGLDGKKLEDEAAVLISKVGENVSLKRAVCLKAPNLKIAAYTHPSTPSMCGKYGALLVYETACEQPRIVDEAGDERIFDVDELAKQFCQHIIGMKPEKIGVLERDEYVPKENKDEERVMIHQEFLPEPEILVSQILQHAQMKLLDFERFECGEDEPECAILELEKRSEVAA